MPMIPVKEVNKGVAISEPEVKEHAVDLLIVGGGMGSCGAAYEAVRYVYSKEADVLQNWISKCISAGKAEAVPAEDFLDAGNRIFEEFKAIPLADMQAEPYHSLQETAGRVYDFLT